MYSNPRLGPLYLETNFSNIQNVIQSFLETLLVIANLDTIWHFRSVYYELPYFLCKVGILATISWFIR